MMPAEQSFTKIQVKDDTDSEVIKAPTTSERSSASTATNKSSKPISPRSTVAQQGPSTTGRLAGGDHLTSEFIRLKNIDGETAKRAVDMNRDDDDDEPIFKPIANVDSTKSKTCNRVRFDPKEMPSTASMRDHREQRTGGAFKSVLRARSSKMSFEEAKHRRQAQIDVEASRVSEADIVSASLLTAYKERASNIATTTQFWDFWRSFKNEPETQEWCLKEIGPQKFKQIFAKGIESDVFWSIFIVLRYTSIIQGQPFS